MYRCKFYVKKYLPPLVTTQARPASSFQMLFTAVKINQYKCNYRYCHPEGIPDNDLVMGRPRLPRLPSPFRSPRRSELSAGKEIEIIAAF